MIDDNDWRYRADQRALTAKEKCVECGWMREEKCVKHGYLRRYSEGTRIWRPCSYIKLTSHELNNDKQIRNRQSP